MKINIKTIFFILIIHIVSYNQTKAQERTAAYLEIDTDKIFYETAGTGPMIILIHDGLIHREVWDEQFSFFSKNFKVIRYDRRGYGNSTGISESYSNLEDLDTLFSRLNIDTACLIGMSSGGKLAIDFTLQHPEKVYSLILVGAIVNGFSFTDHFYSRGGHLPENLKDIDQTKKYYISDDPYEIYTENKDAKEKAKELVMKNPLNVHGNHKNVATLKPSYQRLQEIKIPTLILVGEFDIPDVHAHCGVINAGIENSKRIIVSKSGHLIPLEQPTIFNDIVSDFLFKNFIKTNNKK